MHIIIYKRIKGGFFLDNIELTKAELMELIEKVFMFGVNYQLTKDGLMISSIMPKNISEAIEFTQEFLVEKERDKECLSCGRYLKGSCDGTIDRKRNIITDKNRCAAYYNKDKKENL